MASQLIRIPHMEQMPPAQARGTQRRCNAFELTLLLSTLPRLLLAWLMFAALLLTALPGLLLLLARLLLSAAALLLIFSALAALARLILICHDLTPMGNIPKQTTYFSQVSSFAF
jgi:hypothetical protein